MARSRRLKYLSEFLFRINQGLGLRVAEWRGMNIYERALRRSVKQIPSAEEWRAAFGDAVAEDWEAMAREFVKSQYRLILIQRIAARGGLERITPMTRWVGGKHLARIREAGGPAIITTGHAGPTIGIWAALAGMNIGLIRVQATEWEVAPPGWTILSAEQSGGGYVIKKCLKHLRGGGWVAIPYDSFSAEPGHRRVELLGRAMPLPRGIVALAELSGAPLIPVTPRWTEDGRGIEIEVQEPIETQRRPGEEDEAYEMRILGEAMGRLESYLKERPYELHRMRLQYLLHQPKWNGAVEEVAGK